MVSVIIRRIVRGRAPAFSASAASVAGDSHAASVAAFNVFRFIHTVIRYRKSQIVMKPEFNGLSLKT